VAQRNDRPARKADRIRLTGPAAIISLHDLSIRHRLLVSHIRAVITPACRNHPELKLLTWKEGRAIQDAVEIAVPIGYERVPVAADGFFSLGLQESRANYMVEADRGTSTVKRFTTKLQGFAAWHRQQRHKTKLGITSFRVLTVTSSDERLEHLVVSARQVCDVKDRGRMFLFTTEKELSLSKPDTMLNKIWTSVTEDEPCSIL